MTKSKGNLFKELFKPNKINLTISIIILILWILFLNSISNFCECVQGGFEGCNDYYNLLVLNGCHCRCTSLNEVFSQYFWLVLIPFIIIYLAISLIIMLIKRFKK